MRTDSKANYRIFTQETRSKSALGHVTVREIATRIYHDIYSVRMDNLVWSFLFPRTAFHVPLPSEEGAT